MKTDLGYPQYLQFLTYLDCKKRTKKQLDFRPNDKNDEVLVRAILANSSITEHEGERSFSRVYDAVEIMCKSFVPDNGVHVPTVKITVQEVLGIVLKPGLKFARNMQSTLRKRSNVSKKRKKIVIIKKIDYDIQSYNSKTTVGEPHCSWYKRHRKPYLENKLPWAGSYSRCRKFR